MNGNPPGPLTIDQFLCFLGPFVLAAALAFWNVRAHRRRGIVTLDESSITVRKARRPRTHAWNEFSGFCDDSSDVVELVRPGLLAASVWIPTPTDEIRASVLELLVEHGLPRVER
jgi:hypothetical protein